MWSFSFNRTVAVPHTMNDKELHVKNNKKKKKIKKAEWKLSKFVLPFTNRAGSEMRYTLMMGRVAIFDDAVSI